MIVWMIWTFLFATLTGVAALSLDRVAGHFAVPRRFIWLAAIAVSVVVPTMLATQRVGAVAARPVRAVAAVAQDAGHIVVQAAPSPITRSVERAAVANASADTWAIGIWLVLSVVVLGVFAQAARMLRRERRQWRDAQLPLCRALVAPHAGPAVVGFIHPRVVVPEWALTLDARAQDLMVRHELEHVSARDPQALFVAGLVLVAFPWNPALWWIVRRLRLAMEVDCDARVIRAVGRSHEYGLVLLAVGERVTTPLPLAASLTGARPFLERRIKAMTMLKPRRPLLASLPFAALALVAMTAASSAPRPASLSAIATARSPQSYPTRAEIEAMLAANLPALVSGEDTSNYAVLVLDANHNLVLATSGSGGCTVQVWGDPLNHQERRLRRAERMQSGNAAGASGGGSGRGGRGGGGIARAPIDSSAPRVAGLTRPQNAYLAGPMMMHAPDPVTGIRPATPINTAPRLHPIAKTGDDSGIDGIAASQLTSLEIFTFGDGAFALRGVRVVVVTTNTIGPVK